ncbi:MAG: hypothetical protein IJ011_00320 [Clostridia bacterium]|nr:hypothetical protein [Clostridia bacterium]
MNRTAEKTTAYANDLQSALALECSREDAKRMGTLKEWKVINRKVQKLLRRSKRLERYINASSRTWQDVKDNIPLAGYIALAIFLALPWLILEFAVATLGVLLVTKMIGISFSIPTAAIVWLVYEVIAVVIRLIMQKRS